MIFLRTISKYLIKKRQPVVVFVCGTWGKTMFASAAQSLLEKMGAACRVSYDENNIRSLIAGGGKKFSLKRLVAMLFGSKYPEYLIIELHGPVSVPEDLLKLIDKKFVVIPYISQADISEAGGLEKYVNKYCLAKSDLPTIFNNDIQGLSDVLGENKKGFAIDSEADVRATSIQLKMPDHIHSPRDQRVEGVYFKIRNGGATLPMTIEGGLGRPSIYAVLGAISLMKALNKNLVDSIAAIREHRPLPGRMSLIPGIKKTMLVDDTYDADPESAFVTFNECSAIHLTEEQRRWAVVGDMIKARNSEQAHCVLGRELAGMNYDFIVAIGERAFDIARCAEESGMDESAIFHFTDKVEAGKFIQHDLKPGDLVVVKGSKEEKLESVIKELMAFPLKAKKDLLRR